MATAGRPDRVSPIRVRMAISQAQLGAKGSSRPSPAVRRMAQTMSRLRPSRSATQLASSRATARVAVVADKASELAPASRPNSAAKIGSSGCTE